MASEKEWQTVTVARFWLAAELRAEKDFLINLLCTSGLRGHQGISSIQIAKIYLFVAAIIYFNRNRVLYGRITDYKRK